MKQTASFLLPAAFRSLATDQVPDLHGTLIDPAARRFVTTDGECVATLPFPEGFDPGPASLFLESAPADATLIQSQPGTPPEFAGQQVPHCSAYLDYKQLIESAEAEPAAYRITLDAARLLALAQALGSDEITLRFPASPEAPVIVLPAGNETVHAPAGYFVPSGGEGLCILPAASHQPSASSPVASVAFLEHHEKTGALIVRFDHKPAKDVREILKDPSLGFRYSGGGTKRGIPAEVWYGPDNPYTRERLGELPGVSVSLTPAAAA